MIKDQATEYYQNQEKEKIFKTRIDELEKKKGNEHLIRKVAELEESVSYLKKYKEQTNQQTTTLLEHARNEYDHRLQIIQSQMEQTEEAYKSKIHQLEEKIERLISNQTEESSYSIFSQQDFPKLEESAKVLIEQPMTADELAKAVVEHEHVKNGTHQIAKRVTNRLYNLKVEFEVPRVCPFSLNAILDTSATTCCINKNVVPKGSLEELSYTVHFNGLNSRQPTNLRIKKGIFHIRENKFQIPFIYELEMNDRDVMGSTLSG